MTSASPRLVIGAFATAFMLAAGAPAFADQPRPAIAVTGHATASVPPDGAEIEGGVTTSAKTAREATEANNKVMAAVIAALKGAGIAEADIRTSRLSLQPQFAPNRPQGTTGSGSGITGYLATNQVAVRVHDVSKVATTADTLLGAGANDIGGINFIVSNASQLLDEIRPKAIADAHRKAEIYAKAAGVDLGAPLSITEEQTSGPIVPRAFKASIAAAPTPIAAGNETLTITVNVSYEIKPATP
jgi:uncharacterized protein YggE